MFALKNVNSLMMMRLNTKYLLKNRFFCSVQQDPNYIFTTAYCHFRQENYSKTLEKLNQIQAGNSTDLNYLKLLAKAYIQQTEYEKGLKTLEKIIQIQPGDIETNILIMEILEQLEDDVDDQIDKIQQRIIEHNQEDEGQIVAFALMSLMEEDQINMIPNILANTSSFQNEANRFLAYTILKDIYIRSNQIDAGIKMLEEAKQNCPSHLKDIYFELARFYNLKGDQQKELEALENCLEQNQDQFDVLVELGYLYFTKGNVEKSQEYLKKAEQIENSHCKKFFYEAKMLQVQNKLDEAQKLLEKCLEFDVANLSPLVYNQIGVIYLQKGDIAKAQEIFFKALEINNEEAQIYFNIAVSYNLSKNIEQAINYYEKGLVLQPKNSSAILQKGILQIKQKYYKEAIDTFINALKEAPENTDFLYNLAKVYKLTYDKSKAMELCKKVLSINPNHKEATDLLNSYKNN
ncbi:tetratricopeptide repeat protein (macronuclear) [Tetrahymena thermophila SB210]|uniref:Tetratricopeptide repeat protein n=1 Tax=Tetrahymena thermophila (strain SB210) TaxID=312017 RepID=Q22AJ3_TETTS|nr:tetratricopeptide repeat protein [Tetrahymena thermophila SB210]EAR82323.1 tetratricopeptide repeat protein [Tetrahymena thermophila SB210]|eukprot:XP_001029986.1 tetratricopeptide repeat protein [Tetrahymena thermophila SB210]